MSNKPMANIYHVPVKIQKKYSENFGEETVIAFVERYTRGTYLLAKKLNVEYYRFLNKLVWSVRFSQKRWETFKRVIKELEKDERIELKRTDFLNYLTFVKEDYLFEELKKTCSDKFAQRMLDIIEVFDAELERT